MPSVISSSCTSRISIRARMGSLGNLILSIKCLSYFMLFIYVIGHLAQDMESPLEAEDWSLLLLLPVDHPPLRPGLRTIRYSQDLGKYFFCEEPAGLHKFLRNFDNNIGEGGYPEPWLHFRPGTPPEHKGPHPGRLGHHDRQLAVLGILRPRFQLALQTHKGVTQEEREEKVKGRRRALQEILQFGW